MSAQHEGQTAERPSAAGGEPARRTIGESRISRRVDGVASQFLSLVVDVLILVMVVALVVATYELVKALVTTIGEGSATELKAALTG